VTVEDAIFEYINAAVTAAPEGSALHGAEVHETIYETITKDYGIRIGDCDSELAPLAGGEAIQEFDAYVVVVIFWRVEGADKSERRPARNKARALALATAKLFFDDQTMGGRVRDSMVDTCVRGYDSVTDADEYAVVNMPLWVNMSGQQLDPRRRERY
jgi:hypothetical protein